MYIDDNNNNHNYFQATLSNHLPNYDYKVKLEVVVMVLLSLALSSLKLRCGNGRKFQGNYL